MNDDRSSLSVPSRQSADADISVSDNPAQKQAAANIVRGQIDTIYQNDPHATGAARSEEHTSELQSHYDLVCRLLLEKKNS